jgi:GTP-binding protein
VYIKVPLGTLVRDEESGRLICDVFEDGQEVLVARGGNGGKGNVRFTTARRHAPNFAQKGEHVKPHTVILEMKVIADVGLVGFPNAGKSTLLSVVSAAKPEIADYPFTTLTPQLGIVSYRDNQSFCMADIPGIIEGAAEGRGLGLRFLRHIERNAVLLFMVPVITEDIKKEYEILLAELEKYNPQLLTKARILAISKCDIADPEIDLEKLAKQLAEDLGIAVITFSSASGMGITELKDLLWEELNKEQNQVIEISHSPIDIKVIERAEDEDMDEDDEPHTIYLNEVEEEWDLDKYRGIGWDTQE